MPRPSNEELTNAYMRDLEIEIECNAREIAAGRTDLNDYDAKCRRELAALRVANGAVRVDRYGIPVPQPETTPMVTGTAYFVNFTKACDYYRGQGNDELTPAELERFVRGKLDNGEIFIGKPDVPVGGRLILLDAGTRYGIEEA